MHHSWNETFPVLRRDRLEQSRREATCLKAVVAEVVCHAYGIRPDALEGPSRGMAHVSLARQVAMYLVSTVGNLDHAAVGRLFGRDRTTVRHACAVVENRRDEDTFEETMTLMQGNVEHLWRLKRGLPTFNTTVFVQDCCMRHGNNLRGQFRERAR